MLLNLQYHSAVSTPLQAARPAAGQKERERRGRGALGRAGKLIRSSISAASTRPVDSMLYCMRSQCVQVLSKHDEQQRRLQLVISVHLPRFFFSQRDTAPHAAQRRSSLDRAASP